MRDIARLLFGDDAGKLTDLFGAGDGIEPGPAERLRHAREWCSSTPGRDSAPEAVAGPAGPRRTGRRVITRQFPGL
jgi:hypothetical protein